jgi:hypothetical protein
LFPDFFVHQQYILRKNNMSASTSEIDCNKYISDPACRRGLN